MNPYFQDEWGYEVSDGGEEGEGEGSGRHTPAEFAPEIIGSMTSLNFLNIYYKNILCIPDLHSYERYVFVQERYYLVDQSGVDHHGHHQGQKGQQPDDWHKKYFI